MTDPSTPGAVIRAQFDAVNRRDWQAAMAAYADDVVLEAPSQFLNSGTFSGRDAVGAWFGDWMRTFGAGISFEILGLEESGEQVALWAHHTARGGHSGVELEADFFYNYTVRAGKIVGIRFRDRWDDARAAL